MSVWVCSRERVFPVRPTMENYACGYLRTGGHCYAANNPCDAVEYAEVKKPCKWTVDGDGVWYTECGNAFVFDTGGPTDNKFKVCPYCGGALLEEKG